ncbi:ABC transporter permease [Clostridium aminobutyricum]|uniref:ABC transporter permease n=2 Tax=Clostridium aminobutyricum TaxID=33953 RepID=A0A939DB99_CLOAM|nr:ABC transporter permease [Clostridium aminobutyricum]
MRAFLTMLGIIIGVASVIILVSLMNGLSADMTSQFESMGTNTITINLVGRGGNRTFEAEDVEKLVEENPTYLSNYSPLVTASVTAKSGTDSVNTTVKGVNEYYKEMQNIELTAGRFIQYIDCSRRQNVCIIGSYIANELFAGTNSVGQTLKINGISYNIVGVLEETADSEESSGDDVIYAPYSVATRLSFNGRISTYYVSAVDTDNIDYTVAIIKNALYDAYGSEDAYRVTSMTAMIDQVNEMTGSIAAVLVGIAGISLVVGGIGIMNIMLVSVTERTREIGIRKALGARRKNIMQQFIIEAATTSAMGGIIGIFFGIFMAFAAGKIMDMTVIISAGAVLVAFSVSVGIGVVFGYFPANKAAKMRPIDALRYD